MSTTARNILIVAGLLVAGYLIWYFNNIVLYILSSLVLALIGRPIFDALGKVRFRRLFLPDAVRSLITLLILITLMLSFFGLFIPLLVVKIKELSTMDPQVLMNNFSGPLEKINRFINRYVLSPDNSLTSEELVQQVISNLNITKVAGIFGSIAGWLGNLSVAFFSIAFITFFFLKDENLFSSSILLLIPEKHTHAVSNAMQSTRKLLSRYFAGIMAEVTGVIILSTIGLLILGFSLKDALLVGFLAGIFNIIPYLGPAIGTVFGLFVGIVSYLGHPDERNILVLSAMIIVVFMIVQFIDNMLIQPFVYSSSVHAHPLEIFLVFLVAGSIGGLAGMILAIPAYTVLRVFAKEFLNHLKLVQSLTRHI
jgi:predicted PurR-regulated permease PerM